MTADNEPKKRVDSPQGRTCEHCHVPFQAKNLRQKYCSKKCCWTKHGIGQVALQHRTCDRCGNPFKQQRMSQRFCSQAFRTMHHNERKTEKGQSGIASSATIRP